jgi:hypothetical protein
LHPLPEPLEDGQVGAGDSHRPRLRGLTGSGRGTHARRAFQYLKCKASPREGLLENLNFDEFS